MVAILHRNKISIIYHQIKISFINSLNPNQISARMFWENMGGGMFAEVRLRAVPAAANFTFVAKPGGWPRFVYYLTFRLAVANYRHSCPTSKTFGQHFVQTADRWSSVPRKLRTSGKTLRATKLCHSLTFRYCSCKLQA